MRWAQRQRQAFIARRLAEFGFINRQDLMGAFSISAGWAAIDFRTFMRLNPGAMVYNTSTKRYEAKEII